MKITKNLPKFWKWSCSSLQAQNVINKVEDLNSFKTEQVHFVSSLNKTLGSLEESPLYKNRKHFTNLSYYKDDFGMDIKWPFFATSLDKDAYDGIEGAIIRLARKASLWNLYKEQIITPKQPNCTVVKIPSVILE